ncbi:MAG: hypothetical protein IPH86_12335 [bacterium]|nr:hypothetical protein [bacterium]
MKKYLQAFPILLMGLLCVGCQANSPDRTGSHPADPNKRVDIGDPGGGGGGPSLAISSVTGGNLSHGETVTISGTSFGANNVANDLWDNMESGSFSPSWSGTGDPSLLTVENAGSHARSTNSTKNAVLRHNSSSGNGSLSWETTSNVWYNRYWVKIDSNWGWGGPNSAGFYGAGNYQLSNVKIFDMGSSGVEMFKMAFHSGSGPRINGVNFNNENVADYDGRNWWVDGYSIGGISKDVWHLFQFEFRRSSAPLVRDGMIRFSVDRVIIEEVFDMMTNDDEDNARTNQIVGFMDTSNSWGYDGANTAYFDDFYLNKSLARVEIGNASTYATSSIREIQLPSSWSETSIGVTVNTGSFANGTAYLFVIDAGGTQSAGYQIVINN